MTFVVANGSTVRLRVVSGFLLPSHRTRPYTGNGQNATLMQGGTSRRQYCAPEHQVTSRMNASYIYLFERDVLGQIS